MCKFWKKEDSNHHFPELNQKRNRLQSLKGFFTPKKSLALVAMAVCGMSLFYLIQTNGAATDGYQIKDLQTKLTQLSEENKKLNLKYTELQSMANVVANAKTMNLVAETKVEIIGLTGSVVAMR